METELKFQVPPAHRAALLKAVATATARTTPMRAVYADTADHRLARAGLALRLRQEGRQWVQALKGRAEGAGGLMQRLEHEVPVAGRTEPALDPARHAGTPVGERLLALLADGVPLLPVYRTSIRRVHRVVRHAGARIELAFDQGDILAGDARLPVCEIEFELLSGPPQALPALAARWVQRFGLWWDIRTKSERGFRLALGDTGSPAKPAARPEVAPGATPAAAFAGAAAAALQQALASACEIAGGTGGPDHLHQLRQGLRRLRSLLRTLGGWSADAAEARRLEADWRAPFARLGACRDRDVFAAEWLPRLQAAGAPALPTPGGAAVDTPDGLVREAPFQLLLLRSLALLCTAPPQAEPVPGLQDAAPAAVAPLWKQTRRGARGAEGADVAARHRLRKRLKRLRDVLEALQPLLRRRAGTALLKALRRALQTLGQLNDLATAEAAARAQAAADPALWFAAGWLRARHDALLPQLQAELEALAALKLRWREPSRGVSRP